MMLGWIMYVMLYCTYVHYVDVVMVLRVCTPRNMYVRFFMT